MILDPALLGIAGGSFAGRTEPLVLVPIVGGPRIDIVAPARGWTKAEEAALAIAERRETQRAWPEAKQFLQQHHAYSEQEPTKG